MSSVDVQHRSGDEVLTASGEGQRVLVHQAAPGTAEHDALVLLAMTAEDSRAR